MSQILSPLNLGHTINTEAVEAVAQVAVTTTVTIDPPATAALTDITHTAPDTPTYTIQDLVQNTGFGFATADEGNTVLAVIANLQARLAEVEAALAAATAESTAVVS